METTQMSFNRLVDKYNVVYIHDGILHGSKKERSREAYDNMDEPWKHNAERNKPGTKRQILYATTNVNFEKCKKMAYNVECRGTSNREQLRKGEQ